MLVIRSNSVLKTYNIIRTITLINILFLILIDYLMFKQLYKKYFPVILFPQKPINTLLLIIRPALMVTFASLLQVGASGAPDWGSYYKLGQPLLQNRSAITNWGKMYYKLEQVLQIRAIIINWDRTSNTFSSAVKYFHKTFDLRC